MGSVGRYLGTCAVAFVLMVTGIFAAGVAAIPMEMFLPWGVAYSLALCVCLLPFIWFARRVGVHDYDGWDWIALTVFITGWAALRESIPGHRALHILIFAVAFGCFLKLWAIARNRWLIGGNSQSR